MSRGPDEGPVVDLVAQADHPGRAVEPGGVRVALGNRQEGRVVGAPHAAGDRVGERERLEHLSHGGETGLAAHDHDGVVLADVAAGHERQPLGAGGGGGFS
jgi:hypothetical protein